MSTETDFQIGGPVDPLFIVIYWCVQWGALKTKTSWVPMEVFFLHKISLFLDYSSHLSPCMHSTPL